MTSHSTRSTLAVRSGPPSPLNDPAMPREPKSPQEATSPRSMRSSTAKDAPQQSSKLARSRKSSRSFLARISRDSLSKNKAKAEPLLERGEDSKIRKLDHRTRYVPPDTDSAVAAADAKRMAKSAIPRRHEPLDTSFSMDSHSMRQDRYAMESGTMDQTLSEAEDTYGDFSDDETQNYDRSDTYDDEIGKDSGDGNYTKRSQRSMRFHYSNVSENTSFGDSSVIIKQQVAWGCIGLSAFQFAILTTQVLLCGIASLSINPTIGPYPDAFSEWGGKNAYLLVEGQQYFRFITPTFLHVGYLHLLVNALFQLETCAYLEREWGFSQWILIYLISGVGSSLAATALEPDYIGVCSSGALMGLFGARIAQATLWILFETKNEYEGQGSIIFDRLGGTVCSAAVVFFLTFLSYIDFSGHLGGLFTGLLIGSIIFSGPIRDRKARGLVRIMGFLGLVLGGFALLLKLFYFTEFDEDLADACQYFRNLYVEDYACECQAFDR